MTSHTRLQQIDRTLLEWTLTHGAEEQTYPVLMEAHTLKKAGYHEAFPHLMMTAAVNATPTAGTESLQSAGWCLSPAVCYHAYASLEGHRLNVGIKVSARGHCFRNEEAADLKPGRRQLEFQMREMVLIGAQSWIQEELAGIQDELSKLAAGYALKGQWQPASDPFFLPVAQGKAHMQKLLGTKLEFCLSDGLAISSINKHGAFFGNRFSISMADGQPVHSACVAFGLDRWASQSSTHSTL